MSDSEEEKPKSIFSKENVDVSFLDNSKATISEKKEAIENKAEVERYKAGEKQLTGFFMGKLMQISNGKADPKIANSLLRKMLEL